MNGIQIGQSPENNIWAEGTVRREALRSEQAQWVQWRERSSEHRADEMGGAVGTRSRTGLETQVRMLEFLPMAASRKTLEGFKQKSDGVLVPNSVSQNSPKLSVLIQ